MSKELFIKKSHLLKLVNHLPGTTFQYKLWPDGKHTLPYSTRDIESIFFATPAELAKDANKAFDRIEPESKELLSKKIKESAETLDAIDVIIQVRSPNDKLHWIQISAVPEEQRNECVLWFGYMKDVTKEHEETLAQKQKVALLDVLFTSLPCHIYYKDKDSKILGANPASNKFHGIKSNDEIVGKTDFDFYPKAVAQKLFNQEQELMMTGQVLCNEETHESKDGKITYLDSIKSPLISPKGEIIGIAGISIDSTDRIKNEKSLEIAKKEAEESASIINAIFEAIPDQIYYKDRNARILSANPAYYKYHGFESIDPIIGKSCVEFNSTTNAYDDIHDKELELMGQGKISRKREKFIDDDGQSLYFETVKSPLKTKSGKIIGLVGISRDVTKQVAKENELISARIKALEASKAKSDFLAMMSHEIRTPMNGVIGASSLLMNTKLSKEQAEFVNTIQFSGENLLTIINDILDYSKIEAGRIELESIPFSPRECVENAFDLFISAATQKQLELVCDIDMNVPEVLVGDQTRLRQIMINLIGNAIKFTEKGEVGVRVTNVGFDKDLQKEIIKFSVYDTGIGISKEAQARLFQPFTQADSSSTRKYGGTGLGLAISQKMTKLMNGDIWIESTEGVGSTFNFTVKLKACKENMQVVSLPKDAKLSGKRVLVVDDNETNIKIIKSQLNYWGAIPTTFLKPADALLNLQEGGKYDIALLDYQMPVINGEMLAEKIKTIHAHKNLPIVILSSSTENLTQNPAIQAQMTKPVKTLKLHDLMLELTCGKQHSEKSDEDQNSPETHKESETNRDIKILVAEDNKVNQRVVQMMLQRLNYKNIVFAQNGLEAVEAAKKEDFDLILMDVQMPVMNGLQATHEIRKNRRGDHDPIIIALTAGVMEDERESIIKSGMNAFLAKPISIEKLDESITQMLN